MKLLIILLLLLKILLIVECKNRITYYASVGDRVRLQCTSGGGPYFCFSTYTFQNTTHSMVQLNSSMKYTVEMNALTINNVEATDAGFYACSSNCNQMKSDLIDFYLAPMMNQQPVDISQSFIAIPPLYNYGSLYPDTNNLFIPVRPPTESDNRLPKGLNDGQIAGIVIGCFIFVCIVAAIIAILFVHSRKKPEDNNQKKNKKNVNSEESVDSKHDTLKSDKTLINNNDNDDKLKRSPKINRNRSPSNDEIDLPNIDILSPSQRSNSHEIDYQTRKNYEIADRIANAHEEELKKQQQQQQQPKQLTARYDSYNNSFSAGLDKPINNQNQNSNLYSISSGMRSPVKTKPDDQLSEASLTKKLPPIRGKIEFPRAQQPQQEMLQQPNRKYSNRSQEISDNNFGSDSRNESDDDYARRGRKPDGFYGVKANEKLYDVSDEDRNKFSRQTSDEAQQLSQSSQNNPPSFKSLIKQQKQARGINDLLNQQPVPVSRSYQGTTPHQQQMQLPKQSQVVYDKRSESTHVERNFNKDNTTDV